GRPSVQKAARRARSRLESRLPLFELRMSLRTLLAAALAFSFAVGCTKTADTAATSTGAQVEAVQQPVTNPPQAAAAPGSQPDVMTLKRPAGGEWMGLYLQGKKAGWAFTDVKSATFDGQ